MQILFTNCLAFCPLTLGLRIPRLAVINCLSFQCLSTSKEFRVLSFLSPCPASFVMRMNGYVHTMNLIDLDYIVFPRIFTEYNIYWLWKKIKVNKCFSFVLLLEIVFQFIFTIIFYDIQTTMFFSLWSVKRGKFSRIKKHFNW